MPVKTVDLGAPTGQLAAQQELLMIDADVVALSSPHAGVLSSCSAAGDQLSSIELSENK